MRDLLSVLARLKWEFYWHIVRNFKKESGSLQILF